MLKGIPNIISPDLMKVLMEMGHGDEIVLADGNFPAASHAKNLIRCDGHSISLLLEAILEFLPVDTYVEKPIQVMDIVPGDNVQPTIWKEYEQIIQRKTNDVFQFEYVERFTFYNRAKQAYAIVATSDRAQYANIIIKKGVLI